MTGMIAQLLAWPTLGVALLVFGFAPGGVLRLIVLFYRCDNPRRQGVLGELYAVPRIERPFWVAEQLEVALFEGLRDRIRARRDKRTPHTDEAYEHLSGLNEEVKKTFEELKRLALEHDSDRVHIELRMVQSAQSDTPSRGLLADDVARGWRGQGWRGARPEAPTKEDHDPPAGA